MPEKLIRVRDADVHPPTRVCLNFADRCNMACPYCYIPFDGVRAAESQVFQVVEAFLRWRPSSVTVGGGDPLMYGYIGELIRLIAASGAFVQLDTNLHSGRRVLPSIEGSVHMVGVPLDTVRPEISAQMRGDARHSRRVVDALPELVAMGFPVKVNTVVARPNAASLGELADVVASSGARVWSLYEFWPIGDAAEINAERYLLGPTEFAEACRRAAARCHTVPLEIGTVGQRQAAYFFVTQTGRAYTVDSGHPYAYQELGNVIDDEVGVLRKWRAHCDFGVHTERFERRRRLVAGSG